MAKEKKITIKAPFGQPMHTLFCDHYAIHRSPDFTDLDFLCERSGQTLTVRIATEVLDGHRGRFIEYLRDVGLPESPGPRAVHFTPSILVSADLVGLARHGRLGEFSFHAVSWQCALEDNKEEIASEKFRASFYVASIRCRLETQIHWIGNLYEE